MAGGVKETPEATGPPGVEGKETSRWREVREAVGVLVVTSHPLRKTMAI